jgi:hypothetical protein
MTKLIYFYKYNGTIALKMEELYLSKLFLLKYVGSIMLISMIKAQTKKKVLAKCNASTEC